MYQWLLMLEVKNSNFTNQELLLNVELILIMPSMRLGMVMIKKVVWIIIWSKIHGDLIGVIKDILNYGIKVMEKEHVESKCTLLMLKKLKMVLNQKISLHFVLNLKKIRMKVVLFGLLVVNVKRILITWV